VQIAKGIKKEVGVKLADYKSYLTKNGEQHKEIQQLKKDVIQFNSKFDAPQ